MRSLAEYLLSHTTVNRAQMEEAVQNQVILGTSLGAQLLELGAVDETSLLEHSAKFYGIKPLLGDTHQADYAALRLLSASEVDDLDLIPFRVDAHTVWLVCFDPGNVVAQDFVQSKLQRRVQLLLVTEPRFWQILQRYYGIQRGFVARPALSVSSQGSNSAGPIPAAARPMQDLMSEDAFEQIYQRKDPEPDSPSPVASESKPAFLAIDDVDTLPVLTGTVLPNSRPELPATPLVELNANAKIPAQDLSPLDFAQASQELQQATDREAIAMTVLRYARSHFKRVMLFTVHRDKLMAWRQLGLEGLRHPFARLSLSHLNDSVFKTVIDTRAHFLGALKKTPDNIQFLAAVGKQVPLSAVVLPILARGRVVNILYLDAGHKQHCTSDIGELLILTTKIGQSYDDMIRKRLAESLSK